MRDEGQLAAQLARPQHRRNRFQSSRVRVGGDRPSRAFREVLGAVARGGLGGGCADNHPAAMVWVPLPRHCDAASRQAHPRPRTHPQAHPGCGDPPLCLDSGRALICSVLLPDRSARLVMKGGACVVSAKVGGQASWWGRSRRRLRSCGLGCRFSSTVEVFPRRNRDSRVTRGGITTPREHDQPRCQDHRPSRWAQGLRSFAGCPSTGESEPLPSLPRRRSRGPATPRPDQRSATRSPATRLWSLNHWACKGSGGLRGWGARTRMGLAGTDRTSSARLRCYAVNRGTRDPGRDQRSGTRSRRNQVSERLWSVRSLGGGDRGAGV
ncbi:hypothetical protein BKA15_003575 [Microlunatus parietis]|uniref:Uncharacterized protein n=1 Tax=Microlunatus parietis TaxID=682979 RepID=A0A7Y9I958_9ACTN|nr:hypothetical protein [Microlunatus parietis]